MKNNLKNQGAAGSVFLFLVIIVAVILLLVCGEDTHKFKILDDINDINIHIAYAHFSGASKNINNYQIIFQPFPFVPFAGNNSTTLNFSILDSNNSNVNNVYSALVITEKIRTKY